MKNLLPQAECVEEEFEMPMAVIKEKRSALGMLSIGKQKEENLQVKLSIIEELKELVESPDDANKYYNGIQEAATAME